MSLAPRAVVVHRRTELDDLLARHGSHGQAAFFLRERGRDIAEAEERDAIQRRALVSVANALPVDWRRASVERTDLDRFAFAPEDVIVAVGQDGLVANVAKYLDGQPVLGVDTAPGVNPGVLVPLRVEQVDQLLVRTARGAVTVHRRAMVEARLDDGQTLTALNEIYAGHPGHQSARYELAVPDGSREAQSSSGVLVGTGTGASGWCRSLHRATGSTLALPAPDEPALAWFVREAWPSPATGADLVAGRLGAGEELTLAARTDGLVVFGDGMERDALTLAWGQRVRVGLSRRSLSLVVG